MSDVNNIFLEFYKVRDFSYKLQNLTLVVDSKKRYGKNNSKYLDSLKLLVNDLGFDKIKFNELLELYLKSNEKEDFNNLEKYTQDYYKKIEQEIIKVPNSIDKAYEVLRALIEIDAYENEYQVYDALVLLKDEINEEKTEKIFSYWKESDDKIWTSLDFMDDIDIVSHYRFKDNYRFEGFDSIFKKEEFELQFRLLESLFAEDVKQLAFNLWLIDRIPEFINYNTDLISYILKFIARQRNLKGYWDSNVVKTIHERIIEKGEDYKDPEPIFGEKNDIIISTNGEGKLTEGRIEWEPSTYITALCSLSFLKHPVSDKMREIGNIGAKWLSQAQNTDGSWSNFDYSQDIEYRDSYRIKFCKTKFKHDLFVTLIAIESIFRSEIPNKEKYVNRGFEWIKNQQDKHGIWNYDQLFPYSIFPLITVLVLELEKLISNSAIIPKSDYLMMSKDFLNSSIRFLSDESLNSRRLAIITAYHGIEFFLYSALIENDISIFDKSETIGMFKALNQFQQFLKSENKIKKGGIIDFKNSLLELKSYRDNIIHRGYNVEKSKCEDLVEKAREFTSKYSIELWDSDILS
ncbi:hypothetical protein [Methanobacterium sp. ACI-7]|uniref:hypothetical protein n=1 Tax=unclassified Methanobacterium TaxID=2627676 RepID=UPI0039C35736